MERIRRTPGPRRRATAFIGWHAPHDRTDPRIAAEITEGVFIAWIRSTRCVRDHDVARPNGQPDKWPRRIPLLEDLMARSPENEFFPSRNLLRAFAPSETIGPAVDRLLAPAGEPAVARVRRRSDVRSRAKRNPTAENHRARWRDALEAHVADDRLGGRLAACVMRLTWAWSTTSIASSKSAHLGPRGHR